MIKKLRFTYLLIFVFVLISACQLDSKWNCFVASSPTDLEIINPSDKKLQMILLEYSTKVGYKKIGTIKLNPKETKTICLENEGPISNGLFIYYDQKVSKMKLSNTELNKFDILANELQIELTKEIAKAVK